MIFVIELLLQISTTIGMCSVMYVVANQPITKFTVLVWGLTSAIIHIGFKLYETYKSDKSLKINKELENKEEEN